ncbi:O-methyltransferase-domain-containing protein [Aspergillus karnatakaensis]|uniref:O-methyltransferase-domain-containing protein n=1 Tax=Aspergillus karnatakaensis TaxID=1810916 RepID=UPI003CCC9155
MCQIQTLAAELASHADVFSRELSSQGHEVSSLTGSDGPIDYPVMTPEGSAARDAVISAANEIIRLSTGPIGNLVRYCDLALQSGVIDALIELRVPYVIPVKGSKSYVELAQDTGASEDLLRRLIRLAILGGFLDEHDGSVKHNYVSSIFVKHPQAASAMRWNLNATLKTLPNMSESITQDGSGSSSRLAPLTLAYRAGDHHPSMWEIIAQQGPAGQGFHDLMAMVTIASETSLHHLVQAFDWTKIQSLVDVGGSRGHTALAITNRFPHIKCTVQDTSEAIANAPTGTDVAFMQHDFFQPQPLQADAFLYRMIFHDFADEDMRRILSALSEALRPGNRLMIMEIVLPDGNEISPSLEQKLRVRDIQMFSLVAGRERRLQEFKDLVQDVLPNMKFERCQLPAGSTMSLMTWVYM